MSAAARFLPLAIRKFVAQMAVQSLRDNFPTFRDLRLDAPARLTETAIRRYEAKIFNYYMVGEFEQSWRKASPEPTWSPIRFETEDPEVDQRTKQILRRHGARKIRGTR
jgi:hypothetical protein